MRICSQCQGELDHYDGWEKSSSERGGNALEVDYFRCKGCSIRYQHRVDERFTGDIHAWFSRRHDDDEWDLVQQQDWPTSGKPRPKEQAGPVASSPGIANIYLRPYNSGQVLEYDLATGHRRHVDRGQLAKGTRFWRGFYQDDGRKDLGVYATSDGPIFFVDDERIPVDRERTKAWNDPAGNDNIFHFEHRGREVIVTRYERPPSGFDAWSQDEAFIDFFVWVAENVNDEKWHAYYTVANPEEALWWDTKAAGAPGPGVDEEQED